MTLRPPSRPLHRRTLPIVITLLASLAGLTAPPPARAVSPEDAIRSRDLVEPADLAKMIAAPAGQRPVLVHVGFEVLYRGAHIPGATFAGPASRPDGLAALQLALKPIARDRTVVLYCGCCPWQHCPNVAPAFRAARKLGFRAVRVLHVADDMQHDWVDKGYPVVSRKP